MTNLEQHKTLVMDLITQIACGADHHELKPFTQALFASLEKLTAPRLFLNPPTHFVSLSKDLLGVYLAFNAESEEAVRQYLENDYLYTGNNNHGTPANVWKLPWAFIYTKIPTDSAGNNFQGVAPTIIDRTFYLLIERNN